MSIAIWVPIAAASEPPAANGPVNLDLLALRQRLAAHKSRDGGKRGHPPGR
jgi:hypothetical protein